MMITEILKLAVVIILLVIFILLVILGYCLIDSNDGDDDMHMGMN